MRFAVLMSVYRNDKAEEVSEALESILGQTVRPDQIVIVLDGPVSEELRDVLDRYFDRNPCIRLLPLKQNVGLGKALRYGLKYCDYEYVARMDSDDISLPDRFQKQIAYLERHPETDVLGGGIAEYDLTMETRLAVRAVPVSMEEISRRMRIRNPMNHVTVMYKKSAVLGAGNYRDCPYFEDYYLWCRMLKKGHRFHNLEDILVNVRTGDAMYRRRGGKNYNSAIIRFQKKVRKLGLISRSQLIRNLAIRLCVANMPNAMREHFYRKNLRG